MSGADLLVIAAVLTWLYGPDTVAGIGRSDLVALLALGAALVWLVGWAAQRARPSWTAAGGAIAIWALYAGIATASFAHRNEALAGLKALVAELDLAAEGGDATVTAAGELAVTRRRDGTYRVPATLNGHPSAFMFDTGASAAVLTSETARLIGIKPEGLRFRVPVQTANGTALAAPVTLDRLALGPIAMVRVPALVVGPGLLTENLLGQSVLERLDSYEVRGGRLLLRAAKPAPSPAR